MKSFSSPSKRLFTVAAAVSMAGALALVGASSASAAQDNHQDRATAFSGLPAGARILASGSNRYGSYAFVEQSAVAPETTQRIARPDSGGGCNSGEWIQVCAALTGSGLKVSQMTNQTTFPWASGTAEVEILSPSKAQLASWYGSVPQSDEVTAYWKPNPNVNQPSGWYCATSYWYGQTTGTDTASRCVQVT